MEHVAVYNHEGRILWRTQLPVPEDQSYIVYDPANFEPDTRFYYVSDQLIVPRPTSIISVDKTTITTDPDDVATINNIPADSQCYIDGAAFDLNGDDFLVIDCDEPCTIVIRIEPPFPLQRFETSVEITHG